GSRSPLDAALPWSGHAAALWADILHRPSPAGLPLSLSGPASTAFTGSNAISAWGITDPGRALPNRYRGRADGRAVLSSLSRPVPRRARYHPGARVAPPDARGDVRARSARGDLVAGLGGDRVSERSDAERGGSHKILIVSGDKVLAIAVQRGGRQHTMGVLKNPRWERF